MTTYVIIGGGGFGREIIPIVRDGIADPEDSILFADDGLFGQGDVNGIAVISLDQLQNMDPNEFVFNVAVGESMLREKLSSRFIDAGFKPFDVVAKNALNYDSNEVGMGAVLCGFTHITSNAKIGKFFQANIYSYVAHDCVIGDYVTFAPNVHCNGNVHIEDYAYLGTGAIIKQGASEKPLVIGKGAIVGMGAVVNKNVPPYTIVTGNPAKKLKEIKPTE
jgi:sugar O-acyltransferase (sialic acid O-acetyltransferase NeuD family)